MYFNPSHVFNTLVRYPFTSQEKEAVTKYRHPVFRYSSYDLGNTTFTSILNYKLAVKENMNVRPFPNITPLLCNAFQ